MRASAQTVYVVGAALGAVATGAGLLIVLGLQVGTTKMGIALIVLGGAFVMLGGGWLVGRRLFSE